MQAKLAVCISVILLLEMSNQVSFAVPARVANRMIPSWWFTAKNICYRGSDCEDGECCARPMLSANSYCMPVKKRSEICDTSPMMLYHDNEVYFGDCPCDKHLMCAGFQTRSVCIDLRKLDAEFHHLSSKKLFDKDKKEMPALSGRF